MTTLTAVSNEIEKSSALVSEALGPFEAIAAWPAGSVLFREGTQPDGVYVLHSGEVDLSFSSARTGEARSLLVADAGQLLGLTSIVSGRAHDCTATTRTACITGFVDKNRFLRLLEEKPAFWLTVLRVISSDINACWDCMRSLVK